MKKVAAAVFVAAGVAVFVRAQTVLTYNGVTKGDWFAPNVWLNESGLAVNWQDGAVAVITNKEVTLTANATVSGFNVHMTGRYCVYGTGKLTLGAGGIVKTGAGEFNIQNADGLHLSVSQTWTAPEGGMICLDGMRAFTAANDAVLTGVGLTSLRMNANGGFSESNTIYVKPNAYLSLSPSTGLGSSVVLLDGAGNRLAADTGYTLSNPRLGSRLILRNGASMSFGSCTLNLAKIEADAPSAQAVSSVSGTALSLARTSTEFAVSNGAVVQIALPLNEVAGTNAALRKTGAGTLVLNSSCTFSGGVAADEGVLRVQSAAGAGTGAVAVASGATLDLAASGIFSNRISGAGSVVKSGAGTLTLPGENTYAGGTALSGGVVRAVSPASLGSGVAALANGASLVFSASQTLAAADMARISGAGNVLAGVGATVVWSGDYAVPNALVLDAELGGTMSVGQLTGTNYTKSGAGKLRIAGTAGYSGELVVSAGVLEIGSTTNLAGGVTVRTTGSGVVQLDSLSGQDLTKITGTRAIAIRSGGSIDLNTDTLAVTLTTVTNEVWSIAGLTGSADLVKTGPGTVVVSNAASFAGRVRVLEGALLAAGVVGSGTVTVSNGLFAAYGSGTVLLNTYTVAGGALLADAGGSLGSGAISLLAGGTLAATNFGSLGSGSLSLSAGTLRMDAGGTAGTRAIAVSGSGLIQVYDGAGFDNASLTLGGGTLDFRATTTMKKDVTLTANAICSATTPAGAAVPTVGTVAGAFNAPSGKKLSVSGNGRLQLAGGGTFSGGGEIFVIGGGDLTIVSNKVTVTGYAGLESGGKRFAVADGGTFEMAGSGKRLHACHGAGTAVVEVLTGGVFNAKSGNDIVIGLNGGSCTFRVNGGEAFFENGGVFLMGENSAASTNVIELIAGTLRTSRQLKAGTGSGAVVFNGGTLRSDGANSYDPWIATNIAVSAGGAGGAIDTSGLDMKVGSSGISGAGVLTQAGGGTLRFTRPSTNWLGGLTLANGTALAATNSALGLGVVTLGTNTLLIGGNYLLPNTVVAPTSGGIVTVGAGATGIVATLSGGRLIKQGSGGLVADYVAADTDLAIQGGIVEVAPVNDIVKSPAGSPLIWVDASVASSFVTATSNDVSRWYDRRTPGNASGFFATNLYSRPMVVTNSLNGLPVLDFGTLGQGGGTGNNRMLVFKNYQPNIRSVFWVIGSRNGGGFLLGDSQVNGSARHFHRGNASGTYGGAAADPLWGGSGLDKGIVRAGETWTNGAAVNGAAAGLSGAFDLVSWRLSAADDAANNTPGAIWFASCYAASDGRLNGGQELAEVLIYTNRLSDADRLATERYLTRKWFPARKAAGLALGTVSLDGTGTGFVNAYPGPVRVAELVINAADVCVAGAAGGTAADRVTVTAAGVLDASRLAALRIGDLRVEPQATVSAVFDGAGQAVVLYVTGSLVLPAEARFTVTLTGTALPPSSALLIKAEGAVETPSGLTVWTHAGVVSRASRVIVDKEAREIWLSTPRGTVMLLR